MKPNTSTVENIPLGKAIMHGLPKVVRLMLNKGADPYMTYCGNQSALDFAVNVHNYEVVTLITNREHVRKNSPSSTYILMRKIQLRKPL